MATRASDQITLQVVPTPSYIRTYYRLQSSTLNPPAAPTTNPPASPWTTIEPGYTAGSTETLYTVQLSVWGDATFDYGPVQKSSAYEAAKQAYNLATQARSTADGKNKIFPSITQPTATAAGDQWWKLDATGTSIIGVRMWNGSTWTPYQLVAEDIVAAQTITGLLIAANTIRVNHVEPEFGEQLNIGANGSIVLSLGNAANAQAIADLTAARASEISERVGYAQEQASAAAERAAEAIKSSESLGRYYRFNETDLRIGQPGSSAELSVSETGIAFLQNDVPVSLWDGGQMIVTRFVGEEVVLANHKIETRGARTIVRSM